MTNLTWSGVTARLRRSPFAVLWRTFFNQFFTSESVTSDILLHQTIIWVLAFLITPGLFLCLYVLPPYRIAVLLHDTARIDAFLVLFGSVFCTYSMVTIGFIAVFVWDALTFDRRDAMVFGPLPLRPATIIAAKVAALGAFVVGAAVTVNVVTAVPFALVTADREGGGGFLGHLVAHLTATTGAAIFVFAAIVMIRGMVGLLAGARLAARLGAVLQFFFISMLLCGVMLVPAVTPARWRLPDPAAQAWLPPAWFLGLFERLLGSARPEFVPLAERALVATAIAVVGAVVVSVIGFRRQMQLALAPSACPGRLGSARVSRTVAGWITGRNTVAKATTDFILLTVVRNRAQQAPILINAALGIAVVAAALARYTQGPASWTYPRTAVLWIPLILGYWTIIGLRASFFVPSELPAAWTFRANAPVPSRAYWCAVRSSMIALVVPPILVMTAVLLVPLLGWHLAAWHALLVCALTILLVEVVALTIDHVPFTRAYQPGHAKLKTRWPIYALGMFAVAYWPTRLELRLIGYPVLLLYMVACIGAAIVALEVVGRYTAQRWSVSPDQSWSDDPYTATTLNLGSVIEATHS